MDNYPYFIMSFNIMYSLNLFDMYVQTNLYLFYYFNIILTVILLLNQLNHKTSRESLLTCPVYFRY